MSLWVQRQNSSNLLEICEEDLRLFTPNDVFADCPASPKVSLSEGHSSAALVLASVTDVTDIPRVYVYLC